jgi:hypothetical protein
MGHTAPQHNRVIAESDPGEGLRHLGLSFCRAKAGGIIRENCAMHKTPDIYCAMHNKRVANCDAARDMTGAERPQLLEIPMNQQINTVQTFGKDSFDATVKALDVASTGTKAIVVDTADYAKSSFEQSAATFQKLLGVKSLGQAIEIQTDYVKSAYAGFVAQSTKTRELYTKLAQDSLAPFNALRSATQSTFASAKPTPRAK